MSTGGNTNTSGSSNLTEEDRIKDLVLELREKLAYNSKVEASKILKEICSHIKRLHKEVDNMSERLSQLLGSMDVNTLDIVESLL